MIPLIENGYVVNSTGVQYMDEVLYACYGGYGVTTPGTEVIMCQADGTWQDPPTCTG